MIVFGRLPGGLPFFKNAELFKVAAPETLKAGFFRKYFRTGTAVKKI